MGFIDGRGMRRMGVFAAGMALCVLAPACGDGAATTPGGPPPPIVGEIGPAGAPQQGATQRGATPGAGAAADGAAGERPRAEKLKRPMAVKAVKGADGEVAGKPGDAPGALKQAQAAAGETLVPGAMAMAYPADFEAKAICLMPKLGICTAYGKNYNRLASVETFCGKLGGEKARDCAANLAVASCRTAADVVTFYYSTGEKPYTKASAEAKCAEKGWEILPLVPVK